MKKQLMVFGAIAALFLLQAIPAVSAPITFGGTQYELVTLPGKSWDEAQADVLTRLGSNWHLAVITSQAIQDFVFDNLVNPARGSEFWLGGFQTPSDQMVANAGWTWVTGASWSFTNWSPGEPNDFGGPGSEQFLGMWGGSGQWNDEGNIGNIAGYIASSSVPEPGTMLLLSVGMFGLAIFGKRSMNKRLV